MMTCPTAMCFPSCTARAVISLVRPTSASIKLCKTGRPSFPDCPRLRKASPYLSLIAEIPGKFLQNADLNKSDSTNLYTFSRLVDNLAKSFYCALLMASVINLSLCRNKLRFCIPRSFFVPFFLPLSQANTYFPENSHFCPRKTSF